MDLVDLPSALSSVTVFSRGALCTRTARISPASGALPRRVRVTGLPLSLTSGSLRARVASGPAEVRVHDLRQTFDVRLREEVDLAAEERALRSAEDAVRGLEREHAQLTREIAQVSALRPTPPRPKEGDPPRPAPVDAMLSLSRFVASHLASLHRRRRELEEKLVDARNELELRRRRLEESSSARRTSAARVQRAAVVSFAGPLDAAPAELQLELEYFVPGARWYPSYELNLEKTLEKGSLRMRASVAQRSGEDWSGVRLRLSTADLARRAAVPELKALRIGRAQPPAQSHGWRPPPPGLDELFADFDAAVHRRQDEGRARRESAAARAPVGFKAPAPKSAPARPLPPEPPTPIVDYTRVQAPMAAAASLAPPAPPPPPMRASGAMRRRSRRDEPVPEQAEMARAPAGLLSAMADGVAGAFGGGAPADDEAPEVGEAAPEPELAPEAMEPMDALLDYDGLVIAGADGRGRLRVEDEVRRDLAVIGLVATTVELNVQVQVITALLQQHQRDSEGAGGGSGWPASAIPPRASAGSYDYRYDAESAVDVPSDGQWHSVPVAAADVALSPRYVSVPAVEPKVYRTVSIANRSPHALLAGPADVSFGEELAMTVQLPTVPPRGEDRAGLGVEESIQVARNTRYRETTGGLLGGASVLHHEVEIELRNNLARPVPVEVRERVPVPTHEQIKVEEGSVSPPWQPVEKGVSGAKAWQVTVAPGEKAKLSAQYSIRLPGDQVLVGGNRRI
ncbi:MAG TPA: DUF4139 domain-containing protein [Myxococcales bacterium]|nr:DUF4139 domain-containing protein [Myxococcales bacterium]